MHKTLIPLLASVLAVPMAAQAGPADYPTIDRVIFVNECMQSNGANLDTMYKCSCVMDQLTQTLSYDQFSDGDVATHGANTMGERSGLFRDPEHVRGNAKTLTSAKADAAKACNFNAKNL